jgi:hypothetical protein
VKGKVTTSVVCSEVDLATHVGLSVGAGGVYKTPPRRLKLAFFSSTYIFCCGQGMIMRSSASFGSTHCTTRIGLDVILLRWDQRHNFLFPPFFLFIDLLWLWLGCRGRDVVFFELF